jgi:hypothetical protein
MKIALFHTSHGIEHPCEEIMEKCSNYVRVSEYVDVDFPPLPKDEVVGKILTSLDKEATDVRAECERKLKTIQQRRAELLQLPFIPAVTL